MTVFKHVNLSNAIYMIVLGKRGLPIHLLLALLATAYSDLQAWDTAEAGVIPSRCMTHMSQHGDDCKGCIALSLDTEHTNGLVST